MTAGEYLDRAAALLTVADDLLTRSLGDEALPERMQLADTARTAADIAQGYIALEKERRERLADEWRLIATGPHIAPVADVTPIRAETDALFACPECDTLLRRYAYDNGRVREVMSGRLHDCTRRAPAGDAGAPDQQPHGDQS